MPVLNSKQIRAWEEFTMEREPVASIELMERAALSCFFWLERNEYLPLSFAIFCGKGNNGGDGLALARLLSLANCKVMVNILEFGHKGTEDFQQNLSRLHETTAEIRFIQSEEHLLPIPPEDIIIDALLGSGLNRKLEGFTARVAEHINQSPSEVIAIDIPSGLFVDRSSKDNLSVKADHTLSFQCQKPAFMVAENSSSTGEVHILDIGLHPGFLATIVPQFEWIDKYLISTIYKPRKTFAHKGNFGHALIVAGSTGKMGAAILCARACLRSGSGLVTAHLPKSGLDIMQLAAPEVMCEVDEDENIISEVNAELEKYQVIGIGPGIGTEKATAKAIEKIFQQNKRPMVIDADALNLIAQEKFHDLITPQSIITPHPKEFERLFGETKNDFEKIEKAIERANALNVIIVLKGHHTFVASPGRIGYFNSTGNPGMATAGSGDVLAGIITGLVAQGYATLEAALLGVFWHGAAGDHAAHHLSQESMIASDIINSLGIVISAEIKY